MTRKVIAIWYTIYENGIGFGNCISKGGITRTRAIQFRVVNFKGETTEKLEVPADNKIKMVSYLRKICNPICRQGSMNQGMKASETRKPLDR